MKKYMLGLVLGAAVLAGSGCTDGHSHKMVEATAATGAVSAAKANHPGAKVYQSACMSCHAAEGQATVAPPIFAVKDHVIKAHPEREAFIQRIVSWVKAPNADDVLMPGAVKKFGLMPAQPNVSDADLKAVAEFLFDTDLGTPDWYKKHYEEEHGKEHGMGHTKAH